MKTLFKLFMFLVTALVLVFVAAVVLLVLFAGKAVEKTVETFGPEITQVETSIENVDVSLFKGHGEIQGIKIGNPSGYSEDFAFSTEVASVDIAPTSLLSDKIVIKDILIKSPDLRFEQQGFSSNFNKILENVEAYLAQLDLKESEGSAGFNKKFELQHFLMSDSKVTVNLRGSPVVVTLPDIEFKNLGSGPEGITAGEMITEVVGVVTAETLKAYLGTSAFNIEGEEDLINKTKQDANEVMDSLNELKDLFDSFEEPDEGTGGN